MKIGKPSSVAPGPDLSSGQTALFELGPCHDAVLAAGQL
jgi:hypothetical protein